MDIRGWCQRLVYQLSKRRIIDPVDVKVLKLPTPLEVNPIRAVATDKEPAAELIEVTSAKSVVARENPGRISLSIQNIGLSPCLVRLGNEISKDKFNFILASDTEPRGGNGGSLEVKEWKGPVTAMTEDVKGTVLAVCELSE